MKMTINQIAQTQEILGDNLQHLAKHPLDFIGLIKTDIHLAQRYAESFSAGHIVTLLGTAQNSGLKLINAILRLASSGESFHPEPYQPQNFVFNHTPEEIRALILDVKNDITVYKQYTRNYAAYDYGIMYKNRLLNPENFCSLSEYDAPEYINDYHFDASNDMIQDPVWGNILRVTEEMASYIYNAHHNEQAQMADINAQRNVHQNKIECLASTLLSKLDKSVFLIDNNGKRMNVLDNELTQAPSFFRSFWRTTHEPNIFDFLISSENHRLIGQVITLLSPRIVMRELHKPRAQSSDLLSLIIAQVHSAAETVHAVLNKMEALSQQAFEGTIMLFRYDILHSLEQQCATLARRFYEIAPAFLQKQYPVTSLNYVNVGEYENTPPPYKRPPAYNME